MREQALYFIDILAPAIHRYEPGSGIHRIMPVDQLIGCIGLRAGAGLFFGLVMRLSLGIANGLFKFAEEMFDSSMRTVRIIPFIAVIPLFVVWFGIGKEMKIILIALACSFPVYINTYAAVNLVDHKLIEVGKVYRLSGLQMSGLQMIRRLILPAVLPEYIIGLRSGLGLAWMFVVAAEMMGASRGLGFLMIDGQMTGRASVILSSVILFAILGKLSDFLLEMAGRRLLSYKAR